MSQPSRPVPRILLLQLLPLLLALAVACPGWLCLAQSGTTHKMDHERLDEMVACVVSDVRQWLSEQSVREITVGNVQSPPNCTSAGVIQSLTDELKLQKITYKRNAKYQLWGQFVSLRTSTADSTQVAKFEFSLRDRDQDSKVVKLLSDHKVVGRADVEKLLPAPVGTATASPSATTKTNLGFGQLPSTLGSAYRIEGTTVFPANNNRFGVEVLLKVAKDQYTALTPTMEDGVVFVSIPLDAVYAVKLINRSDTDAAVDLSIDGISMFQFCKDRKTDGKPLFTHYIARSSFETLLKGWYRDAEAAYEFLISNADVLSEEMRGLTANERIGVITAQFCIATSASSQSAKAKEEDSVRKRTIVGKSTEQTSEVESWTWDAKSPVATIAIRYDKSKK